ncbi:MAG TPA: hypothetical protein VF783_06975, partial [Terriglobales bacterium]
ANAPAERVPQVDEVGDDDTLVLLRFDFLRQQTLADAALDARDLRLDPCRWRSVSAQIRRREQETIKKRAGAAGRIAKGVKAGWIEIKSVNGERSRERPGVW